MPTTRSAGKTTSNMDERDENDANLDETVRESDTASRPTSSIETKLSEMTKQIQDLQRTLANFLNKENEQRAAPEENAASNGGSEVQTSATISEALVMLNRTLTTSRTDSSRNLYDLPVFDGRPEDWPMFRESFLMTTEEHRYNERQNMLRLQKAIKGKAREEVECLLIHSRNVPRIIETLQDRFGRPEQLVKSQITRIREFPSIPEYKIEQLIPFASRVQNLSSFLEAAQCEHHLANPMLMEELLMKLPVQRRLEWARYAITIADRVTVRDFSRWLQELARVVGNACINTNPRQTDMRADSRNRFFLTDEIRSQVGESCDLCSGAHKISKCERFVQMTHQQRWNIVREKRLCFSCLGAGHRGNRCTENHKCEIRGCKKKTHGLLHATLSGDERQGIRQQQLQLRQQPQYQQQQLQLRQQPQYQQQQLQLRQQPQYQQQQSQYQQQQSQYQQQQPQTQQQIFSGTVMQRKSKLYFKILPVKLYAAGKEITCFAFIDEGSAVSLMNKELAERLDLQGTEERLTLQWFDNKTVTEPSQRVSLKISGTQAGSEKFELKDVRTVNNLQLPSQTLDVNELHLKDRYAKKPLIEGYEAVTPELLIGLDNAHLGVSQKVIADGWKGPAVVQTKLGWIVYGVGYGTCATECNHSYFARVSDEKNDELEDLVRNVVMNDSLAVCAAHKHVESAAIMRAKHLLEETTVRIGERFETGLLWRFDDVALPRSHEMAKKRLLSLEKKFERDKGFRIQYGEIIADYIQKGYARHLSSEESEARSQRTWYLPHFGVKNPNKPNKLRVVFDAAAEAGGVSLNSVLLNGPDQCQPLSTVLMKFRQRSFGVCADIVDMFHQVKIRKEDQDAQRFLWRDCPTKPIEEYVMTVMTFGATCSPSSAQFVKNRNAQDFQAIFPEAAAAIISNHYVDDFVHCFTTEDNAVRVSKEVVHVHERAGFQLKRFVSNSKLVNNIFNETQSESPCLNLNRGEISLFQKVLGMYWDTKEDELKFIMSFGKIDPVLLKGGRRPTKREALSITMSVFDPFGMAAEYSLAAKLVLQSIWQQRTGWDESITDESNFMWKKWLCMLSDVEKIRIPRCYSPAFITSLVELHVFADASEVAYAAVAYWRIIDTEQIKLAFVCGKARCAPLKPTSVPRLELQAALLATRIRTSICESHDKVPAKVYMWSDSRTVLSWIKSDQRRYKAYVAHRVNEILEGSDVSEWRWIPTETNPADFGTRFRDKRKSFWLTGPEFLKGNEHKWPPEARREQTDEELRAKFLMCINVDSGFFKKFSSFKRLTRVVAWINRFRNNCLVDRTKRENGTLKVLKLERAELTLCRVAQRTAYAEELKSLLAVKQVERSSSIFRLTPYLDDNEVIRIKGRIDEAAAVAFCTRRPIIMPQGHYITELIVDFYHQKWKHQNETTITSEIRRKFWIPHIRTAVRRAAKRCQQCKNERAKPEAPLMGSLPEDRLTPFTRPFTYVGIDYMGPFHIAVGRRAEKRWIALFTCLTTRAIHMELARDLSTDTCLMCIRNFTSRRGTPIRIRSDNGTNFVGADRELRRQLDEFDHGKISDVLANDKIEWVFNCPLNPHAGGCWERLVRSVKRAMGHALHNEKLQDHSLYSLMCEAENIVNSRPLTHIPIDSPTDEPLTPNHFLLGTANSEQTPHPRQEEAQVTRKHWRKVQQAQHRFWMKWLSEYLPDLCRRTKWCQPVTPLAVGDTVLVCDSGIHRARWPLGKIIRVFPGTDSQVRVAEVRSQSGVFKRPACKLAKLDVGESRVD